MDSKCAEITPRLEKKLLDAHVPSCATTEHPSTYSPFLLRDRMKLMEQYSTGSGYSLSLNLPSNFNPHTNSCVNIGYDKAEGVSRKHAIYQAKTLHPVLVPEAHRAASNTGSVAFGSTVGSMKNTDHHSSAATRGVVTTVGEKKEKMEYKVSTSSQNALLNTVQSDLSYSKKQSNVGVGPKARQQQQQQKGSRSKNPYELFFHNEVSTLPAAATACGDNDSQSPTVDLTHSSIQLPHSQHVFKVDVEGNGKQSLVSLEQHEQQVSAAVTQRQAELQAVFKARLQTTMRKTQKAEQSKISLVNAHLQQVCSRYKERLQTIYSWLGDVDKARDHIRALKSEQQVKKQILTVLTQDVTKGLGSEAEDEMQQNVEGVDAFTMEKQLTVLSERIKHKKLSVGVQEHEITRIDQEIEVNQGRFKKDEVQHKQDPSIQAARATIASLYASSLTEKEQDEQSRRDLVFRASSLKTQIEQQRAALRQERSHSLTAMRKLLDSEENRHASVEGLDTLCQRALGRVGGVVSEAIARIAAAAAHCDAVGAACRTYNLSRLLSKFKQCPVCLDQLVNPFAMWPCGHIQCGKCVERGVERRPGIVTTNNKNILKRIACQECRAELQLVISSFDMLEELPDSDRGILKSMKIANFGKLNRQDRIDREGHISDSVQARYMHEQAHEEDDQEVQENNSDAEGVMDSDVSSNNLTQHHNAASNGTTPATKEDYRRTLSVQHKVSTFRNPYIFPSKAFNGCHLPVSLACTTLLEQGWAAMGHGLETVATVHVTAKEQLLAVVNAVNAQVHSVLDIGATPDYNKSSDKEETPDLDASVVQFTPPISRQGSITRDSSNKLVLPTQKPSLNRVNVLSKTVELTEKSVITTNTTTSAEPVMSSFLKNYLSQDMSKQEVLDGIANSITESLQNTPVDGFNSADLVAELSKITAVPLLTASNTTSMQADLKQAIELSVDLAPDNKYVPSKPQAFAKALTPMAVSDTSPDNMIHLISSPARAQQPTLRTSLSPKQSKFIDGPTNNKLHIQTPTLSPRSPSTSSFTKTLPAECPTPLAQKLYRETNLSSTDLSNGRKLLDEADLKHALEVVVYQDAEWESLDSTPPLNTE